MNRSWLVITCAIAIAIAGCGWYPLMRLPADKEGALVVRCREVKGWFGRDSHWVMIVWVWSKSGAIPENPGNLVVDPDCEWRVEREPGPRVTLSPIPTPHPHGEPPPK